MPRSQLETPVDQLAGEDLDAVFDDELGVSVAEIHDTIERLSAERARRIAEADRRELHRSFGHPSTASWLAERCRLSWRHARGMVAMAGALSEIPLTAASYSGGEIDSVRVRHLVAAHNAHPDTYARDEALLLDVASTLTPHELRRAIEYWRQNLDHAAALGDTHRMHSLRRLHVSLTFAGMARIDGNADPESATIIDAALRSITEPWAKAGNERSPAQRRLDAFVDICRAHLDHGDTPVIGGERPHISVIVDWRTLAGTVGTVGELDDGTVLHPETIRRLACDAVVTRIVTGPDSQPLDVGRATRAIPRALVARDRGCTWKGCDRPASWCDAHHIIHWADGGVTAIYNLILLCRYHHRWVHELAVRAPPRPRPPLAHPVTRTAAPSTSPSLSRINARFASPSG